MKKKIWRIIFLLFLLLGFLWSKNIFLSVKPARAQGSGLTPPSPAWTNNMIIYFMRLDTFAYQRQSGETPIQAATNKLNYLSDLGINAILIRPIAESTFTASDLSTCCCIDEAHPIQCIHELKCCNYYGVWRPDLLASILGTEEQFTTFVSRAHQLGIKVLVWVSDSGVWQDSPLLTNHPDWFKKDAGGNFVIHPGGLISWDWNNQAFKDWWVGTMVNEWAIKYDLDGFGLDLEPDITKGTNPPVWRLVRERAAEAGKQLIMISEHPDYRKDPVTFPETYHFSFWDYMAGSPYNPDYDFTEDFTSIVDTVRQLEEPYYAFGISPGMALGRPAYFGYMLFSPFLPLWFPGEEFNNPIPKITEYKPLFKAVNPDNPEYQVLPIRPRESLGQNISMELDDALNCKGIRIRAWAESNNPDNRLRISVYRFLGSSYEENINKLPWFQKTFTGFKNNDWLELPMEPTLSPGALVIVIDNAQGEVGIYSINRGADDILFYTPAGGTMSLVYHWPLQIEIKRNKYAFDYYTPLDWSVLDQPENRAFFEKVKKMISIRKQYSQIIHPYLPHMRERNFVAVDASGTDLRSYASYNAGRAIVTVGKIRENSGSVTLNIPLATMNMDGFSRFRVTRLLDDPASVEEKNASQLGSYTFNLNKGDVQAILIEGLDNIALKKSGTASSGSSSLAYLTDNDEYTAWGSGGPAPAWLQLDLQLPGRIRKIRLLVEQLPNGYSEHQLYLGSSPDNLTLAHTFAQNTEDGQWLEFTPATAIENIRYVKVATNQSSSWVAWNEIQVLGETTATIQNLKELLLQYNQAGSYDLNSDSLVNGLDFNLLRKLIP